MQKTGIVAAAVLIVILGVIAIIQSANPKAQTVAPVTPELPSMEPTTSTDTTSQKTIATLETSKGTIVIELDTANTPNTAANFAKLAKAGFYDGTRFHRVISGFMVQGGDPLSKDDTMVARWGTGGPGYQFADELKKTNRNERGSISMANAGPNTNGSQFFINLVDNDFLDTKHTVFGNVTSGMDIVDAIASSATGPQDRPVTPITITKVTIEEK